MSVFNYLFSKIKVVNNRRPVSPDLSNHGLLYPHHLSQQHQQERCDWQCTQTPTPVTTCKMTGSSGWQELADFRVDKMKFLLVRENRQFFVVMMLVLNLIKWTDHHCREGRMEEDPVLERIGNWGKWQVRFKLGFKFKI